MLPKIIGWMTEEEYELKAKRYKEIKPEDRMYPLCYLSSKEEKEISELFPYITECTIDELHIDALMQELVKNNYVICGDTHQRLAIPVFEDGYFFVSMRCWSQIMASAFHFFKRENERPYSEHDFYMATKCRLKERYPNASE